MKTKNKNTNKKNTNKKTEENDSKFWAEVYKSMTEDIEGWDDRQPYYLGDGMAIFKDGSVSHDY